MEMANDDATMEMEHRTTYLATVGTLGPMIGLVGTVYGMILSFRVIATAGSSPQASQLAQGISTALFTTLEGIAVSIPAIYFYAVFRNRIARLSLEVAVTAESLLEQFSPGVVRPVSMHPLAAAAVPATVAGGGPYPPVSPGRPTSSERAAGWLEPVTFGLRTVWAAGADARSAIPQDPGASQTPSQPPSQTVCLVARRSRNPRRAERIWVAGVSPGKPRDRHGTGHVPGVCRQTPATREISLSPTRNCRVTMQGNRSSRSSGV